MSGILAECSTSGDVLDSASSWRTIGEGLGVGCTSVDRGVAGRDGVRDAGEPEVEPRRRMLLRRFFSVVLGGLSSWATGFEGGKGVPPNAKPMLAELTIDPVAQSCIWFSEARGDEGNNVDRVKCNAATAAEYSPGTDMGVYAYR